MTSEERKKRMAALKREAGETPEAARKEEKARRLHFLIPLEIDLWKLRVWQEKRSAKKES